MFLSIVIDVNSLKIQYIVVTPLSVFTVSEFLCIVNSLCLSLSFVTRSIVCVILWSCYCCQRFWRRAQVYTVFSIMEEFCQDVSVREKYAMNFLSNSSEYSFVR